MVKLFVGGFPLEATELELVQMVSVYATVVTIKIVRDKRTNISKGYAFIEVTDQEGAELAMTELSGAEMRGRELTLNIVVEKPVAPPRQSYNRPNTGNYVKTNRFSPSSSSSSSDEKKKRPRRPM